MVYWLKIDGCLFGGLPCKGRLHEYLVQENWTQVSPGSIAYALHVEGIVVGVGEIVETLPVKQLSELPKK